MAIVNLRAPLRQLLEGRSELDVPGATVGQVLLRLESDHPRISGWVLDERKMIRRHVAVFLNGERAGPEAAVADHDRITILGAISGGERTVELLVGTRKGLMILRGPASGPLEPVARPFAGESVEYAVRDARTGTYFAAVTHGQFGPRLYRTDDPCRSWDQAQGPAFPPDADAAVSRIWVVQPGEADGVVYAGVDPAALFRSDDDGRTWTLERALWDEPSRPAWQGGAGGLCLHSICPWPGDPARLLVAVSAAGVWLTDDDGATWRRGVQGLVPRYLPEEARPGALDLCVHDVQRAPAEPSTLYMQFHGGVYRSGDGGESWVDVGSSPDLPSDFGFPLVAHPRDPACAFVIPLSSDADRVPAEGRLRVYRTRDRGLTWRGLGRGLPEDAVYVTVLRQAFAHDGGQPLGLFFGTSAGAVYGSVDEGESWHKVAANLAPVLSVRCSA